MDCSIYINLKPRQRAVHDLYYLHGLRQCEIAAIFRITQQAVSRRVGGIRRAYMQVGITPPNNPGCGSRPITPLSLSDCHNL